MNRNERVILENMLTSIETIAAVETKEEQSTLIVHTESSAHYFIDYLINIDIPTWKDPAEMNTKRIHHSGMVLGWATAGLIPTEKLDEYLKRIDSAVCQRINELLSQKRG